MSDPKSRIFKIQVHIKNNETKRAEVGQHTGDIYLCEDCEVRWIEDFLNGEVYVWQG